MKKRYEVTLSGGVSADDIEAVMCFIIEPDQIEITALGAAAPAAAPDAKAKDVTPAAEAPAVEAKPAASALKEPAKSNHQ